MLSIILGLVLVVSGAAVLALLGRVALPQQRTVLRAFALFDLAAGLAVVVLAVLGILP